MIKRLALALLLITTSALAQDRYTPTNPIPLGDNLLSLPTSHIPSEGTWEIRFTHRFNGSLDQGKRQRSRAFALRTR